MAGIGIQLRNLLKQDTYYNLARAYGFAGLIGAGPWMLSIIGILFLGLLIQVNYAYEYQVPQFQVSVTYLIASSLFFSSFAQHSFTRFIADTLFKKEFHLVVPNFNGLLMVVTILAGVFAYIMTDTFFPQQNIAYRLLMMASFVMLCAIWVLTNLLSGLKDYRVVLYAYFVGYGSVVIISLMLQDYGLNGFLFGFLLGNSVIFFLLTLAIYRAYPTTTLMSFEFMRHEERYYSLVLTSFLFNAGIWADKFIFWYTPLTSEAVIGPLRSSPLYDIPIFLAYLAIIPGMAVFLLRLETDFAEQYARFNDAIREGGSLEQIRAIRNQMSAYAKYSILEIVKVQAVVVAIVFLFGGSILNALGISPVYRDILNIDVIGSSLQVIFLGILNVSFYLDKRLEAFKLCLLVLLLNIIFTLISIELGPYYYGYGFTIAFLISCMVGYHWLTEMMQNLEYKMIMLRK